MVKKVVINKPRLSYDCNKCPAYCCSVYERVQVTKRDINRLARHFGVSFETAKRRYTTKWEGERILRKVKDVIFAEACIFLDQESRGCTIYHSRPGTCREYPARPRCGYYDLLQFERRQQDDENVIPVVQITFRDVKKKEVNYGNGAEQVWEWEPEEKG